MSKNNHPEEEHEDPMKYAYRRIIHDEGRYEPVKYYDPMSNYYNLLNANKIPFVKTTDRILNWEDIFYKKERGESMNRQKELEILQNMETRGELENDTKDLEQDTKNIGKMDYIDTSNSKLNTNCWYNTMFNNNITLNSCSNGS
jgi:hypothetical protein